MRRKIQAEKLTSQGLALLASRGAENKKAEDIEILDVRKMSSICNYFVICTAGSSPQVRAIADGIEDTLEKNGLKCPRWQGDPKSNWIILDLINVVVHVIGKEERAKYKLEDLWGKSGIIFHV